MPTTSSLPAAATATAGAAASGAAAETASGAASKAAASKAAASKAAKTSRSAVATAAETALRVLVQSGALPGLARALGPVRTTVTRASSGAGYALATTSASKTDPLAFLRDPKLSLEQKLIKLLGYLNAKWDKEIQDKLDKIGAGEGAAAAAKTSTSKPKKKGILGSIASAFSSALGGTGFLFDALKIPAVKTALKKLGGPVLAAAASAFGFPAAAPILLEFGPTVVDAALGVASGAQGASSKTSQATSTSGTGSMNDSERQTIMMEVQNIRSKQQEMFGLVSNILKSSHDTRMSIIGNMR